MFGNALANLVVNIIVNSKGFHSQLLGIRNQLQQTSAAAQRMRGFFIFSAAVYAASAFVRKLAEIETGFIRIERVAKEFKGGGFRGEIIDLAQEVSGSSLADIQKIMKITGQIGIRGRDNLLEFSRSMAMMASVTGESVQTLTSDMGKVITVFELAPKSIEKVSNVILQLSDDTAATEIEITNILRRIGSFAKAIGLSVEETAAFAAAMKATGANTEIAASSLFSFFRRLQTEPVAIGKFFGMANEELFRWFLLLRQNPLEAILKLLEKIRRMPASEQQAFFEKLELYGVRNAAALGTLANKVDRLKEALDSANKGAEENIRLLEGQWAVMNSINGKIDDLDDAWSNLMVTMGDTSVIQNTFSVFTEGLNELARRIAKIKGLQHTEIDINDPQSIGNRIKELREIIRGSELQRKIGMEQRHGFEFEGPGGSRMRFGLPKWLNKLIDKDVESLHNITGVNQARKELAFLEKFLSRIQEKNENKASGVEARIKEMTRPSTPAVRQEFENILKRANEEKGKKERADSFRGFMGLTEAWKNLFLDRNKDKEFKELQGIHNEAAEANDHLDDIATKLGNLQFGAILG
jgi:TP901 family phage tail tape measure protein